jgi:hypothetical protein|eukprot:COSAG01_NODE_1232_length_11111_cov_24.710770_11_plen_89_part_00
MWTGGTFDGLQGVALEGAVSSTLTTGGPCSCHQTAVSRAFPSWNRSVLTDIYLCHSCSYHEIEAGNARTGGPAVHLHPLVVRSSGRVC